MTAALNLPALEMRAGGRAAGRVTAPASKSVTNRLLVIAGLAAGVSTLRRPLDSDDSAAMRSCLHALGVCIDASTGDWRIAGTGGVVATPTDTLDARLSGTTARFVTAVLAIGGGGVLSGAPSLRRRPIGPLVGALRALGATATDTDGGLPVRVGGSGIAGGTVDIDVTRSSQFASALLLAAPYARTDVTCRLRGRSASDYIVLTVELMRAWGAEVVQVPGGWRVTAGVGYGARDVAVEYDASAATHLFALVAATAGSVTVSNAVPTSQPDARADAVFEALGCAVTRDGDAVTVSGPSTLRPIDVSLGAMPDQVTTFAALAALAPGVSVLRDVGVARLHETDRLDALATELGRLGVHVDADVDRLTVHGGTARGPALLRTHDDHRLAMAFAAIGARVPGVIIDDPGCVAKTYPAFWDDARALGCDWTSRRVGEVMSTVIAIDGPAGSGKSTIARALARRMGVPHVDTGAYYRALTLAVLRAGVDPDDPAAVVDVLDRILITRRADRTMLNGDDVEDAIRVDDVSSHVSAVARHPRVRERLVAVQRAAVGARGGVVEGRDAATAIVPDATLKVWLTATPAVRAARRAAEHGAADDRAAVARVATQLKARDHADRHNTFRAREAIEVDTTDLAVHEVVDRIVGLLPGP